MQNQDDKQNNTALKWRNYKGKNTKEKLNLYRNHLIKLEEEKIEDSYG